MRVDISEISPDLRACLEDELATIPGARIVRRRGRLFLKGRNGLEILCERLCEIKARWAELIENADLTEEQRWQIFTTMLVREDAKLEEVPGGFKLTVPPSPRH